MRTETDFSEIGPTMEGCGRVGPGRTGVVGRAGGQGRTPRINGTGTGNQDGVRRGQVGVEGG